MGVQRIFSFLHQAPRFGLPREHYQRMLPERAPVGPDFFINAHGNVAAECAARNLLNNLDGTVAEINKAGYLEIAPFHNRKGLVT